MRDVFQYSSYEITSESGRYLATCQDGETGQLISNTLVVLLRSIDALWRAVEHPTERRPSWILDLDLPLIDLDTYSDVASSLPPRFGIESFTQHLRMPNLPAAPVSVLRKVSAS